MQRRLETKYWTNVKGLAAVAKRVKAEDHGTSREIEEISKQDRPIQAEPRVSNQSEAVVLQVARRNTE